ncbi:MAG: hypothetical protein U1F11_01210 [Steroidobacteraceae bacterium]
MRERDWARGWNPRLVISRSGVVERDCVFTTAGDGGAESVWYVTQHDPSRHFVEMIYVTPAGHCLPPADPAASRRR